MRPYTFRLLIPLLMSAAASAQNIPFTISNLNLPLSSTNSTYTTNVTVLSGASAALSGAGLVNQVATLTGTGSTVRERGLNCGSAIQLAVTFTFPLGSITAFVNGPQPKTASTTLDFSIGAGTGLFLGAGGSGTITGTVTPSATGATITGSGSGTIVPGAPPTPAISPSGIVPIYSSVPMVQPGAWISIYGSNFASGLTQWKGDFPKTLGGVSVKIDNKDAYLWFVGSNQINVQVPDDSFQGCVNVVVTTPNGTATSQVTLQPVQPSWNLWGGTQYAAGFIRPSDGSYVFVGPASVQGRAAKVGETVELYGAGFGPVAHPVPAGQADTITGVNPTTFPVTITVGGKQATVVYAGLSAAGSYQVDFVVPQVPVGDNLVVATVAAPNPILFSSNSTQNCQDPDPQGAAPTTCNVYIPVQ
jgi:uncharacterized protein (TIGR03437 family)